MQTMGMTTDREILQHCLNIITRLSPQVIESSLLTLIKLLPFVVSSRLMTPSSGNTELGLKPVLKTPDCDVIVHDLSQELLSLVDVPLKIITADPDEEFLGSEYNRQGAAYRSPKSGTYFSLTASEELLSGVTSQSSNEEVYVPSGPLRDLELRLNEAMAVYRQLYYEGGLSSVYCWELESEGELEESLDELAVLDHFACSVLIKKAIKDKRMKGTWDSIHILDVAKVEEGEQVSFCYKITSTILLSMLAAAEEQLLDMMNISGNLTRCHEFTFSFKAGGASSLGDHVSSIGKCVEEMETKMRATVEQIYLGKTLQAVLELSHGGKGADVGVNRELKVNLDSPAKMQSLIKDALTSKNAAVGS